MNRKDTRKLKFREDGTFRVLMMSDIQESAKYDPRSLRSIEVLLDECEPDLVILGGDNCYGPEMNCEQDLRDFLDIFIAPFNKRGIPWAHVYGNHDYDAKIPIKIQQQIYESYSTCVSNHTDDDVHGKSNFVLPIYNTDGEIALAIWGIDTNHTARDFDELIGQNTKEAAGLPNKPVGYGNFGPIWFDQLMWYWNRSKELENQAGKKIPGLMCMHVAPYEYRTAQANPEICVRDGYYGENLGSSPFNTGLFSTILQRGDIKAICAGHTHHNDMDAEYCGVRLLWDSCVGYRCYGTDERRGGRLFIYNENDPTEVNTYMVRTLGK